MPLCTQSERVEWGGTVQACHFRCSIYVGGNMIRHGVAFAILTLLTTLCYAEHPSLPSSFQSKTIHSPGSSGVSGIQTVVLKGDPNQEGVYTIMLRVLAHTQIAAHSHRADRVATVVSGTWRIGYGDKFDESKLKSLPPGSFYTEPPGENHFAETGDEPVVVQITGFGPSATEYVDKMQDPRLQKP